MWSAGGQAAEGDLDIYAGAGYNTYDFEYHNQLVNEQNGVNQIETGTNYYIGLRGWVTDNWGLGLEREEFLVAADRLYVDKDRYGEETVYQYYPNFSADTTGHLITFACQLSDSREKDVLFIIGAGNYQSQLIYQRETARDTENYEENLEATGVKTGLRTDYHLSSNLMLSGRAIYRSIDFDSDLEAEYNHELIDFTGWELGGGLTIRF